MGSEMCIRDRHGGGPWSRPHCARWRTSCPPLKRGQPPIFGPFLLSPNGYMQQHATWYGGRPQPRRLCVRWGTSFPCPKGAQSSNFRPMSFVAKRLDGLRWHLVQATLCSMGTQVPPEQRAHHQPVTGPCLLWPKGWIDEDAIW